MTFLDLHNQILEELDYNSKFTTDKGGSHEYIERYYNNEFTSKRTDELTIVEIGVWNGGSLELFSRWFENGKIIGIDNFSQVTNYDMIEITKSKIQKMNNVELIIGDGYCDDMIENFEDESIDYLIDDGSHQIKDQLYCIKKYYPKIKIGGKIIIEDIFDIDTSKEKFDKLNLNYEIVDLRYIVMDSVNKELGAQHLFNNVLVVFKK
jgi:hypothetical protein